MVLEILRRISPTIAALFAEQEAAKIAAVVAQDRIRRLESECTRLLDERSAALEDSRKAREQVTDWMAERLTGKPIYGNGVNLAEINAPTGDQIQAAFSRPRQRARDVAREMERRFYAAAGVDPTNGADQVPN